MVSDIVSNACSEKFAEITVVGLNVVKPSDGGWTDPERCSLQDRLRVGGMGLGESMYTRR